MELEPEDHGMISEISTILFLVLVTPVVGLGIYQATSALYMSATIRVAMISLVVGIVASIITQYGSAYAEKEKERVEENRED